MQPGVNVEEIRGQHERIIGELRETVQRGLADAGQAIITKASQTNLIGGNTLKNSLKYRPLSAFTGRVSTPLKHASFQNDGTRAHVIRPRRAKALRFVIAGKVIFARKVNHPGNPATHWFDRAVEEGWAEAAKDLDRAIERLNT